MEDLADAAAVAVVIGFLIALAGLHVWSISWVIRDSRKRGQPGLSIPVLLLFGPFGALAWLAIRPQQTIADKPRGDYQNVDDAFHAASELDALGEWDAAISLFQYAADHWPDHKEYAAKSIEQIRRKQA